MNPISPKKNMSPTSNRRLLHAKEPITQRLVTTGIMIFFGIVMTLQILGATISPNSKSAKHAMIPATTIE